MSRRDDAHAEVVRLLEAAQYEAANWSDLARQDVEQRLGWTDDRGPIEDPEYGAVLAAFGLIWDALDAFRRTRP